MFMTRKKFNKWFEEETHLKKWRDFYLAPKEGYLIKYDGLEYECILDSSSGFGFTDLILKIDNQTKHVTIFFDKPINMHFVTE